MKKDKDAVIYKVGNVTVELAATAGFCFGVDRALRMTEDLLAKGRQVFTLGPLIHNPQVVARLLKRGVAVLQSPEEAPPGAVAVVRSHGMPPQAVAKLRARGVDVCDATCPFVAKIHDIVKNFSGPDCLLLVAGDAGHPEVHGIVGCAAGPVEVFGQLEELREKLSGVDENRLITAVAQTTFQVTKWLECAAFLKKAYTRCAIFDTICNATWARQQEAEALARRSDIVVVVGGRGSSNTQKLFGVAAAHTRAVLVETAAQLGVIAPIGAKRIGVTAGASTPSSVIEEVITRMSDMIREEEKSFEEMLDDSMKPMYVGMIVKGVVEAVSASEVTVDIGQKHTGIVRLEELTNDPAVRGADEIAKRDDEMDLVIIKVNDQDGIIYLSKTQMEARRGAEDVAKAAEDGTVLDGYVIESNKGGLVANVKGVKVFIPASQATARRDEDYTALVRKNVKLKIKEFRPGHTIGSIREVLAEEKRAARDVFWNEVEVGKRYIGTVKSLTSYGVFVDVGGVDGLVHISELSWSRVKHPSEVLSTGDTVEVYVKDVDRENQKVSLGYKKQEDNPWEKLRAEYPVGSVFTAPVVSLTQFGAFVRILPGIDGLVHISEISYDRVEKVGDALKVGQQVEVKLLDVDFERRRISLSIKALLPQPQELEEDSPRGDGGLVASSSEGETVVEPSLAAEIEAAGEE